MTKTSLTPEDVEQIIQSKGKLSAAEVQRRYNIGWGRLQKLWNGANQEPVTRAVPTTKQDLAKQEEIERMTQMHTPQREIVVEDFFARLGQMEAKLGMLATQMEGQTTQLEIQTETMQNILDSLDPQCAEEEALQEIEKVCRRTHGLERHLCIVLPLVLLWLYALCNNKALPCKTPAPVTPAPKVTTPPTPDPTKVGWIIKPKTPDPFEM